MATKSLFEHLDGLTIHKAPWEDTPEFKKNYNQFMISRFIGMQDQFLPLITEINMLKDIPDEVHYNFLLNFLPKKKIYFKYISKTKADTHTLECISDYFEISITEAVDYVEMIPAKMVDELVAMYDDVEVRKLKKRK